MEDTTGSRIALHYLRDKDGKEIDFLAMIDGRPFLMAEGKAGDDTFKNRVLMTVMDGRIVYNIM